MSALDDILLHVATPFPAEATLILDPTELVQHGLEKNLFEHTSNSCLNTREIGSMFPKHLKLLLGFEEKQIPTSCDLIWYLIK